MSLYFAEATGGDPTKLPALFLLTESQIVACVQHRPALERRQARLNAHEMVKLLGAAFSGK